MSAITAIVLTFDCEDTLAPTLESLRAVTDDIRVVDSFSSDRTVAVAEAHGARVVQHAFASYGEQRNWAMDNLPDLRPWLLHLDADERLTPQLAAEISRVTRSDAAEDGYLVARLVRFLGRDIRHGGMYPIWHLRLFRTGRGRCEVRRYDQHFVTDGPVGRLEGAMIDDIRLSLSQWTQRHDRWADAEVDELLGGGGPGRLEPRLLGHAIERKRALRGWYERAPLLLRPFLLFGYRYVARRGFLDGREGLIFFALQTFWFRFLVDAKIIERQLRRR